ncbi:MAG: ABC transporter permease subunit [Ilumatobacteraceae bacterium]
MLTVIFTTIFATIFTKALRDRWLGIAIGAMIAGAFLVLAMAAYQDIDISLYADLPDGVRSVMGIPDDADPATLAYNIVLGMVGAMTLAAFASSMGASSVAGEERDGTIGLLLGNPCSRRSLLTAKAAAMVVLIAGGAAVLLAASYLAPIVLDVDTGAADLVAVNVHLLLNALVWGSLALAIGGVTGNRSLAMSLTVGAMIGAYFLVGLLPLAESLAGLAKVLPWYWFDGHDPIDNGIALGYLALQAAVIVALCVVAWWGVEARDLTRSSGSRGFVAELVDRVRRNDRAAGIIDRLSGGARVGSIWVKTAAEGRPLVLIVSAVMFAGMGLMMGWMYAALEDTLVDVSADLPENLLAMVGGGDMSTPEGWYQLETFGLMAPIAVAVVAVVVGARALAGEERDRTMALLLANPVSRRRVVIEKFVAMMLHTAAVGVATFAGVVGGSLLGGLGMSLADVGAVSLQVTLLGVMFGALAVAIGAASGSVRAATVGTVAAFAASYAINSILSVVDDQSGWKQWTPFDWYLGGDPLQNGIEWSSVGLFVGVSAALIAVAVVLFDRRDLTRG